MSTTLANCVPILRVRDHDRMYPRSSVMYANEVSSSFTPGTPRRIISPPPQFISRAPRQVESKMPNAPIMASTKPTAASIPRVWDGSESSLPTTTVHSGGDAVESKTKLTVTDGGITIGDDDDQ